MKGRLIVSCQALPEEPLHSSYIMGRMAAAAKEGGAAGIRANTKEDITEIKKNVDDKFAEAAGEDSGGILSGSTQCLSKPAADGRLFHGGGSTPC